MLQSQLDVRDCGLTKVSMHLIDATLLLLFLTTLAVPWARRISLPTEIVLVLGSLILSLIPGLPPLNLDPSVVFVLFLPPILFSAAYFTSWRDFKRNLRPIIRLAFGLVLFTTALVAVAAHAFGLGISWPVAFLLGAIVSPPDASAATAIIRKLGVPRQMLTVIEGESLVNDATALVAYQFSLAAIVTGSFSLPEAAAKFALVTAGGIVVGLSVAIAGIFIVQRLDSSTAETTLFLIVAFAAYLCAEHLGFSGVVSTVTCGLYCGRRLPGLTGAQTHLEGLSFWKTVLFIINGLVFTIIGLEMPAVITELRGYSSLELAFYGSVVVIVVIGVRFIWNFMMTYFPRVLIPSIAQEEARPPWEVVTAASWVGMRGIVSLAAALSIPRLLPSGAEFPFRPLLIFLTYVVILSTLLIPAVTLPWLMRRLGIKDGGEAHRDETVARLALSRAALRELDLIKESSGFPDKLVENTALLYERKFRALQKNLEAGAASTIFDTDHDTRGLKQRILQAKRSELERLRQQAVIHDAVFFHLDRELDIEETLLRSQPI